MNRVSHKTKLALAVLASISLGACNDTGDNPSSVDKIDAPTPISKSTSGVITGFGSVFINGVEYETDDSTFIVDGVVGDESLLKLGMVVSLTGTDDSDGTGNAVQIEFEDEVEGLVIQNNVLTDGTLNIMGLTVHTNEDTVFESKDSTITSLDLIAVNNIVEVSGYSSGDGSVWATRIEVKKAAYVSGDEIELKGKISSLNDTQFIIGDMTVDYTLAVLDDDLISGLADGMLVKVESETGIVDGVLVASEIELKSESGKKKHRYDDDDEKVEIEGVITAVVSDTELEINGAPVLLDINTDFVHGDTNTAVVGLKVKAIGTINTEDKLVVEKLVYKPTGDIKIESAITAIDLTNNSVTLLGKQITLDNYTMVKDEKEENDHVKVKYNFGVDDLAVGDWLKVKAYINVDNGLTAIKMKRKDFEADKDDKLVGIIESIDTVNFQLVVAGITIDYSTDSTFNPTVGNKVEVKGSMVNNVFVINEIELEDNDEHYVGGKDGHEDDDKHDDDNETDDNDSDESDDDSEEDDDEHDSEDGHHS